VIARTRLVPTASLLALGLLALAGCRETYRARYATYRDAEQRGAVQRGWIPAFVPRSATDIAEAHQLDMNTQRLRFRAPEAELRALVAGLRPLSLEEARSPSVRAPALRGPWPPELREGPLFMTPRAALHFYYQPADPVAYCLAVDSAARTVYAWSCAKRIT
jgi:hypothetical protein